MDQGGICAGCTEPRPDAVGTAEARADSLGPLGDATQHGLDGSSVADTNLSSLPFDAWSREDAIDGEVRIVIAGTPAERAAAWDRLFALLRRDEDRIERMRRELGARHTDFRRGAG